MGIGIDLKAITTPMDRMTAAFERLADAVERQNELSEQALKAGVK